jgi:hypothetical protein
MESKSPSVYHSTIYVSLCLQSDDIIRERVINVPSRSLRSVECIKVIARQRETFLQVQRDIGLQSVVRNGSTNRRKHDSRLQ